MSTLKLPGLIDPHVHLREPGAPHKETWDSGTAAALAGGFTCVLDMPNNTPPVVNADALAAKTRAARAAARCDYGFHLGANEENATDLAPLAPYVVGLKMYLDQTFGPLRMEGLRALMVHARHAPPQLPLLCHAEGRTIAAAILIAHLFDRAIHICHVSRQDEIVLIRAAKEKGLRVTCEVTPHHLFLTEDDVPTIGAGRAEVRPRLATRADRDALRAHLNVVDCFATDHAPHTLAEKDSAHPPPGFPGLETALPLYLALVEQGWLTLADLVARTVTNPRRIFGLAEQTETWIEVDTQATWQVRGDALFTRARWSPFEGWTLRGRVVRVVLHGKEAYRDGAKNFSPLLAAPGTGRNMRPSFIT